MLSKVDSTGAQPFRSGLQVIRQVGSCSTQKLSHGAGATTHLLRDLLGVLLVEIERKHRFTLVALQASQANLDCLTRFATAKRAIWRVRFTAHPVPNAVERICGQMLNVALDCPSAALDAAKLTGGIDHAIRCDPLEPCPKRPGIRWRKTLDLLISRHEHFLHQILNFQFGGKIGAQSLSNCGFDIGIVNGECKLEMQQF